MHGSEDFFDAIPAAPPVGGAGRVISDTEARRGNAATALAAAAFLFDGFRDRPQALLQRGLDLLLAAVGGQRGFLLRVDVDGEAVEICRRDFPEGISLTALLGDPEGPLGAVLADGHVRVATDPAVAGEALASWREAGRGVVAFVCLCFDAPGDDPVGAGRERWLPAPTRGPGKVVMYADVAEAGRTLASRAAERAREAAEVLRRALEEQSRVTSLAFDGETGLSSRGAFLQALERALAAGTGPTALLYADIDRLSEGRRRHGAGWSEAIVRALGESVAAALPGSAVAGRWGADEVVVLLPATGADGAAGRAEMARRVFAERTGPVAERGARVTIGVVTAADASTGARELLRRAEQAVSAGKTAGGDRWVPWSPDLPPLSRRVDDLAGLWSAPAPDPVRSTSFVRLLGLGPPAGLPDAVPDRALDLLAETLAADRILLLAADPAGHLNPIRARAGGREADPKAPFARALAAQSWTGIVPGRWTGAAADRPEIATTPDAPGRCSVLCSPIAPGGRAVGLLYLESAAPAGFTAADADFLEAAAAVFATRLPPPAGGSLPPREGASLQGPG